MIEKKALRRELIKKRDSYTPPENCGSAFRDAVTLLPEYKNAGRIFCYVSVGHEASTGELIERILQDGKELYIPRCCGPHEMDAVRLRDFPSLVPGMYDIPTSVADDIASPNSIDLIVVPGVSFSWDGYRLGHGAGYYDIYLKKTKAIRLGLFFHELMEETLPVSPLDVRMDIIVTEKRCVRWK
ncbi:MAG: 5-formyltetrahydrofolate cyclo-ligase [Clostridiales bacterium]|nr:5-formyltetrahydrofolate cyclo-ligase [Clostridiales bacterium]